MVANRRCCESGPLIGESWSVRRPVSAFAHVTTPWVRSSAPRHQVSATPKAVSRTMLGDDSESRTASTNIPDELVAGLGMPLVGAEVARLRAAVEEHLGEVDDLRPVDQGLVCLGEDGDAAVLETLDQVDLPQRPLPVERAGHDARRPVPGAAPWSPVAAGRSDGRGR